MEKRRTLRNGIGVKKQVDMAKVYRQLDSGRKVKSVADEWGVSPSTLYRRHREYQEQLGIPAQKITDTITDAELPPLPEEVLDSFNGRI